jgi:hypothetical protein
MMITAAPMAITAIAPGEREEDEESDVVESLDDADVGDEDGACDVVWDDVLVLLDVDADGVEVDDVSSDEDEDEVSEFSVSGFCS